MTRFLDFFQFVRFYGTLLPGFMVAVLLMGVMHQLRCMAKGENLTDVHVLWWNHEQIFKDHVFFFLKRVELAIEFFFWFLYPSFIFNCKLNLEKKVKFWFSAFSDDMHPIDEIYCSFVCIVDGICPALLDAIEANGKPYFIIPIAMLLNFIFQ